MKGRKTGGRKKGAPNKRTRALAVEASGLAPLDYMLKIMRDTRQGSNLRLDAAKSAAPYLYPRLSSIKHVGPDNGPVAITHITRIIVDPTHGDEDGKERR